MISPPTVHANANSAPSGTIAMPRTFFDVARIGVLKTSIKYRASRVSHITRLSRHLCYGMGYSGLWGNGRTADSLRLSGSPLIEQALGGRAIGARKPRQVRKEATVSGKPM